MKNRQLFSGFKYKCITENDINSKTVKVLVNYNYANKELKRIVEINKVENGDTPYYINKAISLIDIQISNGELLSFSESQIKDNKHKFTKWIVISAIVISVAIIITLLSTGVFGSLEHIIRVLSTEWSKTGVAKPTVFGWFHITFICITIVVAALLVIFLRKVDDKKYRFIVFSFWTLIFIFEIFKEVLITYKFDSAGHIYVDYNWIQFPFQFCSTPYFALPFIFLFKKGKLRKAFESYSSIFMFVGGFANYCFPQSVFFDSIFLSVQSLIHHGTMIALSIYITIYNKKDICLRNSIPSFGIFIGFTIIAIILNEVMWQLVPAIHSGEHTFNMFFISTHFPCPLPIFDKIFDNPAIPKWVSIIIFILGFCAFAYIAMIIFSLLINHKIKPCFTIKKSIDTNKNNQSL